MFKTYQVLKILVTQSNWKEDWYYRNGNISVLSYYSGLRNTKKLLNVWFIFFLIFKNLISPPKIETILEIHTRIFNGKLRSENKMKLGGICP